MLTKRSVKEKKESLQVDEDMRKMEEAAMKAYMKDIESNPDYTSQVIIDKLDKKSRESEIAKPSVTVKSKEEEEIAESRQWYEAQSDEGHTYYWNTVTGKSVWEPPEEGFVSLSEQSLQEENMKECKEPSNSKETPINETGRKRSKQRVGKREQKEIGTDGDDEALAIGPTLKPDPYGTWKSVDKRIPEPVDLQLPQQDYVEIKLPIITEQVDQPHVKFKEKTVTSLSAPDIGAPSAFKKRKFNSNRANMRRKLDESGDSD